LGRDIKYSAVLPTGWSPRDAGEQIFAALLLQAGIERRKVDRILVTGYGRVSFNGAFRTVTEISCHARGVAALCPEARTIIDIGGQDSKVISINENGKVMDFAMNDKCAAGTGRFLQIMANTLGMDVGELAASEDPSATVGINSMCTVFAESEIIGLLARGSPKEGIIAGLHQSVGKRAATMARRLGVKEKVVFTGGVAQNAGVRRALEEELKSRVFVPGECQLTGALGAALLAAESKKLNFPRGRRNDQKNDFTFSQ
jgi:predicted CoA-substrate-specific enzyme activase